MRQRRWRAGYSCVPKKQGLRPLCDKNLPVGIRRLNAADTDKGSLVLQGEEVHIESGIGITFDGCDWDKIINLKNGYAWECGEYGYTYHYGTLTVLEVNGIRKLCVGDVESAIEEFPDGDCYSGTLYNW